jgi:beta-glucuronidase
MSLTLRQARPLQVDIAEAGAKTIVKTDPNGNAPFSFKATKLILWSPESPKL